MLASSKRAWRGLPPCSVSLWPRCMVALLAMRQARGFRPGARSEGLTPCCRVWGPESPRALSTAPPPPAGLRP
eukprot:4001758-Alexandrium_andersonii.AAC.1